MAKRSYSGGRAKGDERHEDVLWVSSALGSASGVGSQPNGSGPHRPPSRASWSPIPARCSAKFGASGRASGPGTALVPTPPPKAQVLLATFPPSKGSALPVKRPASRNVRQPTASLSPYQGAPPAAARPAPSGKPVLKRRELAPAATPVIGAKSSAQPGLRPGTMSPAAAKPLLPSLLPISPPQPSSNSPATPSPAPQRPASALGQTPLTPLPHTAGNPRRSSLKASVPETLSKRFSEVSSISHVALEESSSSAFSPPVPAHQAVGHARRTSQGKGNDTGSLAGFRSGVLDVEVRLHEQLTQNDADISSASGDVSELRRRRLEMCSTAFEDVIAASSLHGPILRMIKEEYDDACLHSPAHSASDGNAGMGSGAARLEQANDANAALREELAAARGQCRDLQLAVDNLKREREVIRADADELAEVLAERDAAAQELTTLLAAVYKGEISRRELGEMGFGAAGAGPSGHSGQPPAGSAAPPPAHGDRPGEFEESLRAPSQFAGLAAEEVSWEQPLSARGPVPRPPQVPKLQLLPILGSANPD